MARAGGFAVRLQPVFSALQLNVWQECTKVPGGFETLVSEIERRQPDLVTLSEVRNYDGVDFTARLCESLKQKGLRYYSQRSDDSGIITGIPSKTIRLYIRCRTTAAAYTALTWI